jgi:hypothetical protein
MHENSMYGNCEIPPVPGVISTPGRRRKAQCRALRMHAGGKSDDGIVPEKLPNKAGPRAAAEVVEGRPSTKGNAVQAATPRTQSRTRVSTALHCVRAVVLSDGVLAITQGKSRMR